MFLCSLGNKKHVQHGVASNLAAYSDLLVAGLVTM